MSSIINDSSRAVWGVIEALGPAALVIGLSAFLGKRWADQAARNHNKEISRELEHLKAELRRQEQKIEGSFAVGVMSHMANVAFDKHIEFCEAYLKEADQALADMLMNASAKTTMDSVVKLAEIRRKYALWESKEMSEFLTKFQKALSEIWATDRKLEHSQRSMLTFPQRQELVTEFFGQLQVLVGITPEVDVSPEGVTRERVLQFLRSHLGANDLNRLRLHHLSRAAGEIASSQRDLAQNEGT